MLDLKTAVSILGVQLFNLIKIGLAEVYESSVLCFGTPENHFLSFGQINSDHNNRL